MTTDHTAAKMYSGNTDSYLPVCIDAVAADSAAVSGNPALVRSFGTIRRLEPTVAA